MPESSAFPCDATAVQVRAACVELKLCWGGSTMYHVDDLPFGSRGKARREGLRQEGLPKIFRSSVVDIQHDAVVIPGWSAAAAAAAATSVLVAAGVA